MSTYMEKWLELVRNKSPILNSWKGNAIDEIMEQADFAYPTKLSDAKTPKEWRSVSIVHSKLFAGESTHSVL